MKRGAEASILGLTILGWVLSYSALRTVAEAHRYAGWEAWLWPLTVDLLALSCALLALVLARRGRGPTGEAWALAGLAGAVTLAGNAISAWGDPIAVAMHTWPAICMLGAWHLYFRSLEAEQERSQDRSSSAPGARPPSGRRRAPAAERVRVLQLEAQNRGERLTGNQVARALRLSPSYARKLLARQRERAGPISA